MVSLCNDITYIPQISHDGLRDSVVSDQVGGRSEITLVTFMATKEYARLFIPPGATLHVDVLHWRWIGGMPKREDPVKIITKAWQQSGATSEADALKIVLNTLWAWHCNDNPGSTCPHDFDSLF